MSLYLGLIFSGPRAGTIHSTPLADHQPQIISTPDITESIGEPVLMEGEEPVLMEGEEPVQLEEEEPVLMEGEEAVIMEGAAQINVHDYRSLNPILNVPVRVHKVYHIFIPVFLNIFFIFIYLSNQLAIYLNLCLSI